MNQQSEFVEFSRPIEAASIGPRITRREVQTSLAERAAIAAALDLVGIDHLTATVNLRRLASGLIEADGTLEADVIQSCVVSLEPVPAHVTDTFRVTFGTPAAPPALDEIDIDYEELDPPEPILDGVIDLGPLVVEHLSLALDPYPRKPDAAIPKEYEPGPEDAAEVVELKTHKPFSGLDKLIK